MEIFQEQLEQYKTDLIKGARERTLWKFGSDRNVGTYGFTIDQMEELIDYAFSEIESKIDGILKGARVSSLIFGENGEADSATQSGLQKTSFSEGASGPRYIS